MTRGWWGHVHLRDIELIRYDDEGFMRPTVDGVRPEEEGSRQLQRGGAEANARGSLIQHDALIGPAIGPDATP